ncbi:MAG: VCBS repeat-containing protein, partial [Bryobacteraceae bacterium]|nr:VCBS repeat-containing protein [Bryobacteraceae bacterium]
MPWTRRRLLTLAAIPLGRLFGQGVASRGVKPLPRGKPSGLPFHARFTDVARQAGLTAPVIYGGVDRKDYILETIGCGAAFFDYDNDGWLDLFTTHGNAHHEYVEEDTLVRNKGDGTFEDVSDVSGQYFHQKYVGRGATYGDYDNDGDLDLVVVNLNDFARLLRNDGGNRRHWLKVEAKLAFPTGARDAIGA